MRPVCRDRSATNGRHLPSIDEGIAALAVHAPIQRLHRARRQSIASRWQAGAPTRKVQPSTTLNP